MTVGPAGGVAGSASGVARTLGGWVHDYAAWHRDVRVTESASATAFWVLLSLGPAGLVAINVLGLFVPQEEIADRLAALADSAPGTFGDLLVTQFQEVARATPGTFPVDALLVVTSLWTISTAVAMLLRGLRRGYGLPVAHLVPVRVAAACAGLSVILLMAALAFAIDSPTVVLSIAGRAFALVLVFAVVVVLYRLAVGGTATLRRLAPGAVVGAAGLVLIQLAWESVTGLSPNLTLTYGTITGAVVSMLGVWMAAYVLLLGQFVNHRLATGGAVGDGGQGA